MTSYFPDLRVLVGQCVEAVRAGGNDALDRRVTEDLVQHLDVLHRLHLEEELVADAAGRISVQPRPRRAP